MSLQLFAFVFCTLIGLSIIVGGNIALGLANVTLGISNLVIHLLMNRNRP